jgi:polar amino acid transport system permease protein
MPSFIAEFFKELYLTTGLNFTIFYDAFDRKIYLTGLMTTIQLAVGVVIGSLMIGLVAATIRQSRLPPLRWLITGYITLFRNTPQLAQLYFFYYGLGVLMPKGIGPDGVLAPIFNNFTWSVIAFSLTGGAFNAEILRSGIQAVPKEMNEAADALGYSKFQTFIYIVLPLALRISLPALNNSLVTIIKGTTVAYAIGVQELLTATTTIMLATSNVVEMMTILLVSFLGIVSIWVVGVRCLERRFTVPGFGV